MIKPGQKFRRSLAGAWLAAVFCLAACGTIGDRMAERNGPPEPQPAQPLPETVHLFFGNPSNAVTDDSYPDNYLLVGSGSVISYNNSRGTPNWVSWRTVKADLGPSLKRPDFRPDPRLPRWFTRITHSDYSGSGYDRGHMVPSADRFASESLNEETFYLSNIVPQTPALNQYAWEKLESYARGQARRGSTVYQIAGVYGTKEVLKDLVAVPAGCWKIIAIVAPGRGLDRRTRVIAVDMPNTDDIEGQPWERFKTTVRAIEERTGYDFFAAAPRPLQDVIETRRDDQNRSR